MKLIKMIFLSAMIIVFASCVAMAQDNTAEQKEKVEVKQEIVERAMPSYTYNLKKLMEEAKDRIGVADEKKEKADTSVTKEQQKESVDTGNNIKEEYASKKAERAEKAAAEKAEREKARAEREKARTDEMAMKQKIHTLHKDAMHSYRTKQYEASENSFKEILKLDPSDEEAKEYLEKKIPARLSEIDKELTK